MKSSNIKLKKKNNNTRIAILIPAYNEEKYIGQFLNVLITVSAV